MLVVFANNLTLVAPASGTTIIYTDPVAVNGNSRATAILNIHQIFSATNLLYEMEGSNDGVNFVTQGPSDAENATGVSKDGPDTVSCAYVRIKFTLVSAGAAISSACFDLHVNFDSE